MKCIVREIQKERHIKRYFQKEIPRKAIEYKERDRKRMYAM